MTSRKFTFAPDSTPLDGYTIKRGIQRGGFGEVYYAHSDGGKEVALKLLHSNADIELRGTRQCLNLKHPNLIAIFDVREDDDGDTWVVMEYISGPTLDEVLVDQAPAGLDITATRQWLAGLAAGADYLHDRGIVHRDLKPQNLYLEAGVIKVGDIGLSKMITPSQRGAQTESIGTVYYMAPEVSRGEYGPEVDVYSASVVLYEMLTGRVPFEGETTAEILMKHLSDDPDLSPLPIALRPVLARGLTKDPADRTPTVGQLLAEFDQAQAGRRIPTPPPQPMPTVAPSQPVPGDGSQHSHLHPNRPQGAAASQPVTANGSGTARVAAHSHRPPRPISADIGPLAPRPIRFGRRALEATAGMTAAILFTALLTIGSWLIGLFGSTTGASPPGDTSSTLAGIAYGLSTLVAAWTVLLGTKTWEGTGEGSVLLRRLSLLVLGSGVGAASWWIHRVLLVDLPPLSESQGNGLIESIGSLELVSGSQPSLAGYIAFFGLLLGARRWWWHTDSFRPKRLRVFSLILTLMVSALLGLILQFPVTAAIGWGLGISIVVQLSAPFVSVEQRPEVLRTLRSSPSPVSAGDGAHA